MKEEAAMKKSGFGQDELYTSKWLFFQPQLFLRSNLILQVTETNLKRPQTKAMQSPREGICPVLGKILPSTWKNVNPRKKNNAMNQIAEIMESIVDNISTRNESLPPSETTESKSEDKTFSMII